MNSAFLQFSSVLMQDGFNADDFGYSIEAENSNELILKLVPGEVYNQFIFSNNIDVTQTTLRSVELCYYNGANTGEQIEYGAINFPSSGMLYLSFRIRKEFDECLRLKLNFDNITGRGQSEPFSVYSNLFSLNKRNIDGTTLVTYRHTEILYGIPYTETETILWQQIRLPVWYARNKTEQDSEETVYDTGTPTNINVSRVQRRFLKVWRVIAPDWMNKRIGIVSDHDYIYFDGIRQISRPFVFDEISGGSTFSISEWETQPIDKDRFKDNDGIVSYPIVIRSITAGCCDESGTPTDPRIVSVTQVANGCENDGWRYDIVLYGQPNTTAKFRLTAQAVEGQTKIAIRHGAGNSNTYSFVQDSDFVDDYYFFDDLGGATITIESCFEECNPGYDNGLVLDIDLFDFDMLNLIPERAQFGHYSFCPAGTYKADFDITSNLGDNQKAIKIINGEPNGVCEVVVQVLKLRGQPKSSAMVDFGSWLSETGFNELDSWTVQVPLDGSGESVGFVFQVTMPDFPHGANLPELIVIAKTKYETGYLTGNTLTLTDV